MLAVSPLDQGDHSLMSMTDDFSSYFHQAADSLLINTNSWFDTLLDERNDFCSVSSSACPSITSELSDFDALMNESFTQENLERTEIQAEGSKETQSYRERNNIKHQKKKEGNLRKSKWSGLSFIEKTAALEDLMETVSEKFGLREQLDIIKIIDPNAHLSPTDTEFFIDFDKMDDRKYDLMNIYVDKELRRETLSTTCEEKKLTIPRNSANKILKQKRKIEQKERLKKRDKLKVSRQKQKERKSGLFSRNQVIAMASFGVPEGSDEEIDILS